MRETLELAKDLNCAYANFYAAMAYPGALLYQDALARGLPLPESWAGYSQYAYEALPLPTRHLSGEDVLAFRDHAFEEYYSRPEYQAMMEARFGPEVLGHLKEMLRYRIPRRHALK